MAENKIELIKELADWIKDNKDAVKKEGKSIFIGVFDETCKINDVTVSFVGTPEALMVLHEELENAIKENAEDMLKYFLEKMMED